MFTKPPHLVAAQILICKGELDIVGRMAILVYLNLYVSKRYGRSAMLCTLVTVTSVLFFMPNASATFLGNDI